MVIGQVIYRFEAFFEANSAIIVTGDDDVICDGANTNKCPNMVIGQVIYRFEAFFEANSVVIVTGDCDVTCDRPNKAM
jgi:hydroxyethylthiazole kinase-like sugar kinase family protein